MSEESVPETRGDEDEAVAGSYGGDKALALGVKPRAFKNRFLNFVRFGSVINGAAETFFKSEIRRRLFVTAVLIVISRVGYFIPLPGFDRRLIPKDYMSFVAGSSVGKLRTLVLYFCFHFLSSHCKLNDIHVKICVKLEKATIELNKISTRNVC